MKQVVSLVKDGHVQYALVDDDAGELVPFAEIVLPNPDRFGLHEAAVLGTNLITALGLDRAAPKAAPPKAALPVAEVVRDPRHKVAPAQRKRPYRPRVSHDVASAWRQRILADIIEHPGTRTNEVAARLNLDRGPVTGFMRPLLDAGTIRAERVPGEPQNFGRKLYAVVKPEPAQLFDVTSQPTHTNNNTDLEV